MDTQLPAAADRTAARSGNLPAPDAEGRRVSRMVIAGLFVVLAAWVARSYLVALGWAVIIAVSVWPLYGRLRDRLGGSRLLAPLVTTILLGVLLVVPVAMTLIEIGREGQFLLQALANAQAHGAPVPGWVQHLPLLGQRLDAWWQSHLTRPEGATELLGSIDVPTVTSWFRTLGGELATRAVLTLITFVALFGLLRHGERVGERVLALVDRWLGAPGDRLAEKMAVAVRDTVNGTLLVALGEGILIGIAYWVAGVPHAILFGILTCAFAMLPLGAWLAFGAAALVLLASGGSALWSFVVVAWGAAVMLIGDNVVQPTLIGGTARLPFLWALVGILGGLETFGLIGLFVGPVLMAALLTIWRHWMDDPGGREVVPSVRPGD